MTGFPKIFVDKHQLYTSVVILHFLGIWGVNIKYSFHVVKKLNSVTAPLLRLLTW